MVLSVFLVAITSASGQIFGTVNTNFLNVQSFTNSGPIYTNGYNLLLPSRQLILTNVNPGQTNWRGAYAATWPAGTNVLVITNNFAGYTNTVWATNTPVFYIPFNAVLTMWVDPGLSTNGIETTNGIFVQ